MRFFETVLAGAALVAAAFAVEINDFPSNPEVGKTYTITYSPKDNTPTTLLLRKGDSNDLQTVATLTTTATGGSFQWTVDSALPNGNNYALQIKQGDQDNYSKQFPVSGSNASPSASASASASASISSALSSAISSALSSASSAASAASTLTTSASASVSTSAGTNTTISSATLSATKSGASTTAKASGSSTSTGGAPANTGAASTLGSSPLALVFGAIAAIAYVH